MPTTQATSVALRLTCRLSRTMANRRVSPLKNSDCAVDRLPAMESISASAAMHGAVHVFEHVLLLFHCAGRADNFDKERGQSQIGYCARRAYR